MNIIHSNPTSPVEGFRAQVALPTAGLGVIRGTAADQANLAGAAPAAQILGVTDLDAAAAINAGVAIRRALPGTKAYVQAGAAFLVGALLTTNAAGLWITCTTTQKVLAIADAPAAAINDLVPAVFQDGNAAAP